MDAAPAQALRFGGFRLDAQRRQLVREATGEAARLTGRAFEALAYLAARPGVLVPKAELMAALWPGVTVEENSLTQCISALRRALGDSPGEHRFIVTEAGRGYRFVGGAQGAGLSARRRSDNPQANQLYVSGWSALTRPGAGNLERGLRQLERAVLIDPGFALAHVCIADGYALLGVFGMAAPREVFPKARAAVTTALDLDDGFADAHAELGHIQAMFDLDPPAAEASYRRALALDPGSALAQHYRALQLICAADFEGALIHLRQAQALEPLAANVSANIGMAHYYAGRYHEAIAQLEATLELDPEFAHARSLLGRCRLRLGDIDEALGEFARRSSATIGSAADVPAALAIAGRTEDAQAQLRQMIAERARRYVSAYDVATVCAALGDRAASLDWLETALAERAQPISYLAVDPVFRGLHGEPRVQQILRRLQGPARGRAV